MRSQSLHNMPSTKPVPSGTRSITPRDLAEHFGETETWWQRQRPAMVQIGLLKKVGRRFFGDMSKIESALADGTDWTTPSDDERRQ
jgi:hypothetical protein